jgi:hypothetical protein
MFFSLTLVDGQDARPLYFKVGKMLILQDSSLDSATPIFLIFCACLNCDRYDQVATVESAQKNVNT